MGLRFPKSERLSHKKLFESLFQTGKRAFKHPLMLVWQTTEDVDAPLIQVGFSAPKKHYKRAVDRNLIKRRLREAYRLNNAELKAEVKSQGKKIVLLFVLVKTDNISFEELSPKIMLLLRELDANS